MHAYTIHSRVSLFFWKRVTRGLLLRHWPTKAGLERHSPRPSPSLPSFLLPSSESVSFLFYLFALDTRPAFTSLADKSKPPRCKLTSALSLFVFLSCLLLLFSLLLNQSSPSSSSLTTFILLFLFYFLPFPSSLSSSYTWLRLAPSLSFRILMIHWALKCPYSYSSLSSYTNSWASDGCSNWYWG